MNSNENVKTVFKSLGEIKIGDSIVLPNDTIIKVAGVGTEYGKHFILAEDGKMYPTGNINQKEQNIEVIYETKEEV